LANSEASSAEAQPRRRFTTLASPLTPFMAAAHTAATFGQACISAS
jgi:hypothetical protein